MVGKPNQKIPRALLQPIPASEEPFRRVVHCIPTQLGHTRY